MRQGQFRRDLFYRLSILRLQLPPLRERVTDILPLAESFLKVSLAALSAPFSAALRQGLQASETVLVHYDWPGNIRELKNVVERSVYRHGTSDYPLNEIVIDPFRRHAAPPLAQETRHTSVTLPLDLREFQQQQEKEFLQTSLQQAKFNQKKAAELLGLTYHQLRALLKKHQI